MVGIATKRMTVSLAALLSITIAAPASAGAGREFKTLVKQYGLEKIHKQARRQEHVWRKRTVAVAATAATVATLLAWGTVAKGAVDMGQALPEAIGHATRWLTDQMGGVGALAFWAPATFSVYANFGAHGAMQAEANAREKVLNEAVRRNIPVARLFPKAYARWGRSAANNLDGFKRGYEAGSRAASPRPAQAATIVPTAAAVPAAK